MSQLAIGIIETVGLAACIEAADACVKSANVNLVGYELSKGAGMAVLKIEGNVAAVKAAIDAGIVAANKVSKVFAYKVIPRPSECVELLIRNEDTIGYKKEIEINHSEENIIIEVLDSNESNDDESNQENKKIDYTCNLCKDFNCQRQKGELRTSCIHYKELKDFKEEE